MCPYVENQQSDYCKAIQQNTTIYILRKVKCCNPITGTLTFRAPSFSGVLNNSFFIQLEEGLDDFFKPPSYPVDSVAIVNREENEFHHLLIDIQIFPFGKERFNGMDMDIVISGFTTQSFTPPYRFGPYVFKPDPYKQLYGKIKAERFKPNLYWFSIILIWFLHICQQTRVLSSELVLQFCCCCC